MPTASPANREAVTPLQEKGRPGDPRGPQVGPGPRSRLLRGGQSGHGSSERRVPVRRGWPGTRPCPQAPRDAGPAAWVDWFLSLVPPFFSIPRGGQGRTQPTGLVPEIKKLYLILLALSKRNKCQCRALRCSPSPRRARVPGFQAPAQSGRRWGHSLHSLSRPPSCARTPTCRGAAGSMPWRASARAPRRTPLSSHQAGQASSGCGRSWLGVAKQLPKVTNVVKEQSCGGGRARQQPEVAGTRDAGAASSWGPQGQGGASL